MFLKQISRYILMLLSFLSCENEVNNVRGEVSLPISELVGTFTLADFYTQNSELDRTVDSLFEEMDEKNKVAQMIVTALGRKGRVYDEVLSLVQQRAVGGVVLLTDVAYKRSTTSLANITQKQASPPLLFSTDAEPSLINGRIKGIQKFPKTNTLNTEEKCRKMGRDISAILEKVGIHQNYAPVLDISFNKAIINNRSFGKDIVSNGKLASYFTEEMQANNIVATAKHFPGHGNVKGDSHKKLVYIDGALKELSGFEKAIKDGVLSVMVGHIAIQNNKAYDTKGLPSTLSKKIVTNLLREKLNFQGIIVTDAMTMKAVTTIPDADLKAALAGNDIILMPKNEAELQVQMMDLRQENTAFKKQTNASIKRIIRMKVCLGLFAQKYIYSAKR